MARRNTWRSGKWKAVCDECGREYYNTELRMRWDKLMVCRDDYEVRHPQDFLRGVRESPIPWSRPEPADVFVPINTMGNGYVEAEYFAPNPDPIEGYYWI